MNSFKLKRILTHKNQHYFNVPYGDEEERIKRQYEDSFDIPIQTELGEKFPWAGYITIEGKIYKCEPCAHENAIRRIIFQDYMDEYLNTPASFYDKKPKGMLQEEYFAMKYLGFVKVSSFEYAPTKRMLFRYKELTYKQIDIIYPR